MEQYKLPFFFLRLPIALSLAGHGLVRLPQLSAFAEGMVADMDGSIIPETGIWVFSYFIPVAEAILGLLLLLGIQIRYTLFASLALMALLVVGASTVENWSAVESQLIHSAYLGLIYWFWIDKCAPIVQPEPVQGFHTPNVNSSKN